MSYLQTEHLSDEQLLDAYYGEQSAHLDRCPECQARFSFLSELLRIIRDQPVPERTHLYGQAVWAKLQPQLPLARRPWTSFPRWSATSVAALLLAAFFVAGMLTEHRRTHLEPTNGDRVRLTALSDHLDRTEILLTELLNHSPDQASLRDQQEAARELLGENRILRLSAARHHRPAQASLLGELERTLLDVANSPVTTDTQSFNDIREQIEANSLLFKVRVVTQNIKLKGQTL